MHRDPETVAYLIRAGWNPLDDLVPPPDPKHPGRDAIVGIAGGLFVVAAVLALFLFV